VRYIRLEGDVVRLQSGGLLARRIWPEVLMGLAGVDANAIALVYLSFGGYVAPWAATVEHRRAACVGLRPVDPLPATTSPLPALLARQLPTATRCS
jgi:hypothetical protein